MPVCTIFICALLALLADQPTKQVARDPELRHELLHRTEVDQRARFALVEWMKARGVTDMIVLAELNDAERTEYERLETDVIKADTENTAWLKQLVDRQGWPAIMLVADDGAHAAWLLGQHADADVKFQRRCRDLMIALPKDEVPPSKVAYLTDRVLLAEGKKQIYGTQFSVIDGRYQPRPLEDEANVDRRRAAVGLETLAENLKRMEEFYGPALK